MLPAASAVLVVLAVLHWLGEEQGLYGSAVGVILMTGVSIGMIGGLLSFFAAWLDRDEGGATAG